MAVSENLVRIASADRSGHAVLDREERIEALERELRVRGERIDELQSALKARDDFLSVAAHELRNPMHALSMQIALIARTMKMRADPAKFDTELAERIELVHVTLRRYVARTTVLLDVSRSLAGMRRLERVQVDLNEIVCEAIALYRSKAIHHRVDLQVECKAPLIGYWDRVAIEQVVENLLSNAIKFGAGAPVIVRAAPIDPQRVCLSVSDSGVGICAADQQRIFAKFEKAVASSYTHGGFGVGLWLVRSLVEAHGGTIQVESAPGKGAVFTVVLPLDEGGAGTSGADRQEAAR